MTQVPPARIPGADRYPEPRPGIGEWLEEYLAEQRRHRRTVRTETRRHRAETETLAARLAELRASWLPPCEAAEPRVRWRQPPLDEAEAETSREAAGPG